MSTLEDWTAAVCADLGVDRPDTAMILDLAREVAHGVARPAAPLTTYLVGVAAGAGMDPAAAAALVTAMAQRWSAGGQEAEPITAPLRDRGKAGGAGRDRSTPGRMDTRSAPFPTSTRRALLLGVAVGAVAGCSTAAVPYNADESGQLPGNSDSGPDNSNKPAAAMMATQGTGATAPVRPATGTVLGDASDIPVGSGVIYTAEKVVVTQPVKGEYRAFSAVCTHVGCILNKIADGTIDCPCHGSEFRITNGAVVAGPAPTPLPRKKIKIRGGKVILL
jgi:Rieske Fe-S protein